MIEKNLNILVSGSFHFNAYFSFATNICLGLGTVRRVQS